MGASKPLLLWCGCTLLQLMKLVHKLGSKLPSCGKRTGDKMILVGSRLGRVSTGLQSPRTPDGQTASGI